MALEGQDTKKAKPTGNPRRQEMLDLVAQSTEDLYVKDGMEMSGPEEDEEEVEENTSPNAAEEEEVEEEEKPDTEEGDSDEGDEQPVDTVEKKLYSLKVNGNELQMTEDELIRRAQEGLSAQQKFEEAARLRKEAELIKAQPLPEKDVVGAVVDDDRALARALQMGTEEEAAQVIAKIRSRPPVQTDDAARLVDERLSFRTAAEQAMKEFAPIFQNPALAEEFASMDKNLIASGDKRSYAVRFKEIGEILSHRHGLKKHEASTLEQKKMKKASVTPIRPASARSGSEAVADDYEATAVDGIHHLIRSRGPHQFTK